VSTSGSPSSVRTSSESAWKPASVVVPAMPLMSIVNWFATSEPSAACTSVAGEAGS
jgi:hypothetical protein